MELKLDTPWQRALDQIKTWARVNSPWAIHYNSGSCNGCDIEILATLTPRYDLERFGVKLLFLPMRWRITPSWQARSTVSVSRSVC